jgi:hypothetical protein
MRRLILVLAATVLCLTCLAPPAARAQAYGDPSSLVDYWYRTYLGRPVEPAGLEHWLDTMRRQPADQVLALILGSDEYYSRAGGTPEGFISRLYVDLLKRRPSPAELDFWVRRLYIEDRSTVADEILTQNPGVWVGAGGRPAVDVTPGVIVNPRIEYDRHRDWDRDRSWDWDRHRDTYDYRRPYYPYQRGEERHRNEKRR